MNKKVKKYLNNSVCDLVLLTTMVLLGLSHKSNKPLRKYKVNLFSIYFMETSPTNRAVVINIFHSYLI